jgi:hypothetical protein
MQQWKGAWLDLFRWLLLRGDEIALRVSVSIYNLLRATATVQWISIGG